MKWFASVTNCSAPFEIKHTKGSDNFKMRELSKHQRDYLLAATTENGMTYKIRDANIGHNPFDCFHYKNSHAYVVIVYPCFIVAIEIQDMLKIKTPSLFITDAVNMAHFVELVAKI